MAARREEGCYEKNIFTYCLVDKGPSHDDVRVARGTVLQEIAPGAGDFIKKSSGDDSLITYIAGKICMVVAHVTVWESCDRHDLSRFPGLDPQSLTVYGPCTTALTGKKHKIYCRLYRS